MVEAVRGLLILQVACCLPNEVAQGECDLHGRATLDEAKVWRNLLREGFPYQRFLDLDFVHA